MRANSTGRANKFDQLIRKGCNSGAEIKVWLRNVGLNAYKHSDYGDAIIVHRIIRPSSNRSMLENEWCLRRLSLIRRGKCVSDRKRDLADMLKHFNIKIENPLVFMEQTTMKQFIQGDEKVKYEVLMQAMNFKSLEQK